MLERGVNSFFWGYCLAWYVGSGGGLRIARAVDYGILLFCLLLLTCLPYIVWCCV